MIKISPKFTPEENGQMHQWGYELMKMVFDDLVFSGNLSGFVPAGTDSVTIDADLDTVRHSIVDIWMECAGIDAQPDEILSLERVYRMS